MPATRNEQELPSTIQRSDDKAKRTWAKAHDSAVETYGEGERAHRTAYSALKHTHEKRGDHWEPKRRKGPSDPQAAQGTPTSRNRSRRTHGGVDSVGNSKQDLLDRAKQLG
ncbi:MAG TPA: ChaB family protein, partial [Actinomycetota bacterium]